MTESPTSDVLIAITAASVGLSTLFPMIDGNALIGAFAGSVLLAINSTNLTSLKRLAYMLISLIVGYLAAPEVVKHTPLSEAGVAAFFASAAVIPFALRLTDLIKKIELPNLLKK